MTVRAKFRCVTKDPGTEGATTLEAVLDGTSEENKEFFKHTPNGRIYLSVVNPVAFSQFEPGVDYYVDFTRVGSDQVTS